MCHSGNSRCPWVSRILAIGNALAQKWTSFNYESTGTDYLYLRWPGCYRSSIKILILQTHISCKSYCDRLTNKWNSRVTILSTLSHFAASGKVRNVRPKQHLSQTNTEQTRRRPRSSTVGFCQDSNASTTQIVHSGNIPLAIMYRQSVLREWQGWLSRHARTWSGTALQAIGIAVKRQHLFVPPTCRGN